MSYRYRDHQADIVIEARGSTVEDAFQEAARAMYDLMVDIDAVQARKTEEIECEAASIESLLPAWLNALLSKTGLTGLVFSEFKAQTITNDEQTYYLKAKVRGEKLNSARHNVKTEVKAATYAALKVEKCNASVFVQCLVDV